MHGHAMTSPGSARLAWANQQSDHNLFDQDRQTPSMTWQPIKTHLKMVIKQSRTILAQDGYSLGCAAGRLLEK
jgi:hypothetical protein